MSWSISKQILKDKKSLTSDKINFILEQVRLSLSSSLGVSKELEKKASTLLIVVGFYIIGLGTISINYVNLISNIVILSVLLLGVIVNLGCNFYTIYQYLKSLQPKKYYLPGNQPKNILIKSIMKLPIIKLKLYEIENYQFYIETNRHTNSIIATQIYKGSIISILGLALNLFIITIGLTVYFTSF